MVEKENIIYFPEDDMPDKKQKAKEAEKVAGEKSPQRSLEKCRELFKIGKGPEASVGVSRREFKDWWLGKEEGKGAKDLAEVVFNHFLGKINALEHKEEKTLLERGKINERDFIVSKEIEPFAKLLVEGMTKRGAQEDILLYFMDEWRPQVASEAKQKIWRVFQEYVKELSEKEDIFDGVPEEKNKDNREDDKEEPRFEPDDRLRAISKEEAREWVDDIEKAMKKKISGAPRGEFKKWWLGEKGGGVGEGGEKLAEWVFNNIAHLKIFDAMADELPATEAELNQNFKKDVEPTLKRFIEEVIKHGAQEDVWNYFWNRWALNFTPQITEKVWGIYKKYFEETAEKI